MSLRVPFALALGLALVAGACGTTDAGGQEDSGTWNYHPDGSVHYEASTPVGDGGIDPGPTDNCSAEAKLVYIVAEDGDLLSFDPSTTPPTVVDLGSLGGCPTSGDETPFSMGVDRDAIAWVLSSNGNLFRVDIKNNLACTSSGMTADQQGMDLFGMGFVTNDVGGTIEQLFIAGSATPGQGASTLGTLSFPDLKVHPIHALSGSPELTGNSNAELWGFYPDTTPPKISKIDKTNGTENPNYPLSSLAGQPSAWAFAFWGGDFYVFLQKDLETETTVYHVNGTTGALMHQWTTSQLIGGSSHSIVGAGVSTCAPVIIG
jgi:hypothetical protein